MRKFWLITLLIAGSLFLTAARGPGSDEIQFLNADQFYSFGEEIVFQVKIQSQEKIKEAYLLIQPRGETARMEPVTPNEEGEVVFRYAASEHPLRSFAPVTYWYRVITEDGTSHESEHFSFDYIDNNFPWQSLENDQFQVNWYQGDQVFGQTILNVAQEGMKAAQTFLPVVSAEQIKVFVYASASDLQSSLQLSQQTWVAGHASPDLGVVLVSIPAGPEQRLELERQIPHELVHILQYAQYGSGYTRLPTWLIEGTASLAELYPNPDYQRILERSAKSNSLLPMASLCNQFPQEASTAFLAYAQSESFVRFLYQKFGGSGLIELGQKYADGLGCSEGINASFGSSFGSLETQWQQESLQMNTQVLALRNLAPYLVLSVLVFLPLLIGSLRALSRG